MLIAIWILFALIFISAVYNYKRTVLVWMPLQFLFNAQIALKYSSPALSFTLGVNIMLFMLYWLRCHGNLKRLHFNNEKFFLKPVFIATLVSFLFSMIFSIVPLSNGVNATIKYFITNFATIFFFQKVLNDEKDIRLFFRASLVVIFMVTTLGIYEAVMKDNPVLDFIYLTTPQTEETAQRMFYVPPFLRDSGMLTMRYGMVRAYSFFGIHIAFGTSCVFFMYLVMIVLRNKWNYFCKQGILIVAAFLLIAGDFAANSKTSLFGIVILMFAFYKPSHIFHLKIIAPVILVIVVLLIYFPQYLNNYLSLIDSDLAAEGGGSTISVRERQMEVVWNMFLMNPVFGNGIGSINTLSSIGDNSDILGAESSWFKLLPERGIFGALVYIYTYFFLYKKMREYIPKRESFFFLLTLLAMETATGFMNMTLYGAIILVVRRMYYIQKKSIANLKQI